MDSQVSAPFRSALLAAEAARAARRRAESCRERIGELQSGRHAPLVPAERARSELLDAMARADVARQRLDNAKTRRYLGGQGVVTAVGRDIREMGLDLCPDEVYLAYVNVGGTMGQFEVNAHLHRLNDLPASECAVLEHAIWELHAF